MHASSPTAAPSAPPRHDWTVEIAEVMARPFHDLLAQAQTVHRAHFDPHVVEGAMLLSIKTGGCPEDCAYCPQSAKWSTGLSPQRLMATDEIVAAATRGAGRRGHPVLHGRGVALAERPPGRAGGRGRHRGGRARPARRA